MHTSVLRFTAALLLALPVWQPAFSGEKLLLGRNQGATQTLPVLAVEEGYFTQEGLDAELVLFLSTSDGINALNAGKIDVGLSFGVGSPLTFASQGAPIVIIAGNLAGGHPIIAKPEHAAHYRSAADFRGKTVGTPRLYTSDVVFRGAVRRAGLAAGRDLEIVEFRRPIDVLEAVKSGKVDVGVGSGAVIAGAAESGLVIPLWSNDLFTDHPCCRIITTRQVLADRRDDLVRLLKSLLRSEKKFTEDPEAAVAVNMADLQLDEAIIRNMTLDPHVQLSVDPNTKGIITMWDYMIQSEYISSDLDPRSLIDTSVYRDALNQLRTENPDPFWEALAERYREWNED